jgi:hypothetical protein
VAWIDDIRQRVVIALCGVLIKSAGSLMKEDVFSLVLTTIGIIVLLVGLYMALPAMDSQSKEFEDVQLGEERKNNRQEIIYYTPQLISVCNNYAD